MPRRRKKRRIILYVLLSTSLLVAAIFGAKIYLFINQFLGNDIIISLSASDNTLDAYRLEEKKVSFAVGVRSNPFCRTECSSVFESLSKGVINRSVFVLRPGSGITRNYVVSEDKLGSGYALYRFSLECSGIPTFFCHTADKPTSRTVLVRLSYNLTPAEESARDESFELMSSAVNISEYSLASFIESRMFLEMIPGSGMRTDSLAALAENLTRVIHAAGALCQSEDYLSLLPAGHDALLASKRFDIRAQEFSVYAQQAASVYNDAGNRLMGVSAQIFGLVSHNLSFDSSVLLTKVIADYNKVVEDFSVDRLQEIGRLNVTVVGLRDLFAARAVEANLARAVSLIVRERVLCNLSGVCLGYPGLLNLSDTGKICAAIDSFRSSVASLNNSNLSAVDSIHFHSAVSFFLQYLDDSVQNGVVDELVSLNNSFGDMPIDMMDFPSCQFFVPQVVPKQFVFVDVVRPVVPQVILDFSCKEKEKKCCLGTCTPCCGNCQDKFFPVVFLHGHAFNEGVSFEYSLDVFSSLQQKLEGAGIINAGDVSSYGTLPDRFFSGFQAPFSLKASYYFDFYKQQENYVVVQTKSENIDSYAVRLNEIIDRIKLLTGRDKVIVVGHSMGGLVARRYLQAFGSSDVKKLVLIAVPNKGIVAKTADYCQIVGQKLECDDMNSGSLFMNKLNRDKPNVPTYNIVGVGCDMDGFDGDGVVLRENSILDGAENFFVNGTCRGVDILHTSILDLGRYPHVFGFVKEVLTE